MTTGREAPQPAPRTIIHFDLDAFFCSVEELLDASLVGTVFAVGGRADERGVLATASYAARKFGLHSAMPTAQALRLCPKLNLLPPRHGVYSDYSHRVMDLVLAETPLFEQISIDEAFLDFTGDGRAGGEIAAELQARIRREIGLPSSFGVATNKLVAKIATKVDQVVDVFYVRDINGQKVDTAERVSAVKEAVLARLPRLE